MWCWMVIWSSGKFRSVARLMALRISRVANSEFFAEFAMVEVAGLRLQCRPVYYFINLEVSCEFRIIYSILLLLV